MDIQAMAVAMAAAKLKEPKFEANGFFKAVFCWPVKETSPAKGPKGRRGSQEGTQKGSQKILELAKESPDIAIDRPDKGGHWEVRCSKK